MPSPCSPPSAVTVVAAANCDNPAIHYTAIGYSNLD